MRIYVSNTRIEKYPFASSTQVEVSKPGRYYADTAYVHDPVLIPDLNGKITGLYSVNIDGHIQKYR